MNLTSFQKSFKVGIVGLLLVVALLGAVLGGQGVAKNYFARASTCTLQKVAATQVTANSAVVTWETDEVSIGGVNYGTNATGLSFPAPEATSGKSHNVPLTLLTPNTTYYYVVTIGKTRCDSTGNPCEDDKCAPWSFSTLAAASPTIVQPTISLPTQIPPKTTDSTKAAELTATCQKVKENIGTTSTSSNWAQVKVNDIDANGIINGLDVIKCERAGK